MCGVRPKFRSLAEYLEKTGRTQQSLAERLGVHPSYVSMLASRERRPGLRLALKIEAETGVPVASFVTPDRVAS